MLQFAGAQAIVTCPLGPLVQTYVGRTDSSTAAPEGLLPVHTDTAEHILSQFEAKGFSAEDLVALLGAHSTAKQYFVDPSRAGASFDATPGQWDVTYYGQVVTSTAEFQLDSDKAISEHPNMSPFFDLFVVDQVRWTIAFTLAWEKMALLGVEGGSSNPNLIDRTSALPTLPAVKRGSMPAPRSPFREWWCYLWILGRLNWAVVQMYMMVYE